MHHLKSLALATTTALLLGGMPLTASADSADLREARQEGSIWTAITLNRHLNPFTIDVDVENGTAILSGSVESDIDRDLAEQVALGIDGIEKVDNRLKVDPATKPREAGSERDLAQRIEDATLTATIKSKLLWNSNTEGMDVNVDTRAGVVTLKGEARSAEAKELAGRLAANTDGVSDVNNLLSISTTSSTAAKAQDSADQAGAAISDGWITSKVKASYLVSNNLDGLKIDVSTENGMVRLAGQVPSAAQKDLAIETARNIRGVRGVDADAVQVQ
ncbi:BON domain-containing protein [Pseudomonas mangrovi]|jgi:osmotically-inducible protein OsmY|uniref:Transporter n=1 Tax=Pseudomonas mangrovi TaxID=2161748 RepID=A0A2T5P9K6_9PSED|nr:BON domain-containing protein [Pseudomonas mangrovi]PTU74426.1 transporter [Pseudomonas mangrovi]